MKNKIGLEKAKKFIKALNNETLVVDKCFEHNGIFQKAHEIQHKEIFNNYLGSCARYLSNKRIKEIKYHG